MKKILCFLLGSLIFMGGFVFAQEADDFDMEDDFFLDLEEDLTDAIKEDEPSEEESAGGSRSKIKQGIWIETVSHNNAIIRDLATGEKPGYEFDNSHLKSYANWWFWGDVTPNFHLDAEIAAWDFDKTLYQANSWGASVPSVSWGDGLQSLAAMPFSFLYNANDDGIGAFNKMGFNILTPYVNVKFGYGNLKENGMRQFTGIYTTLDRWLDVGKGFTEITNGKSIQKFGKLKLDILAAMSMMRGTYGTYDMLSLSYGNIVTGSVMFGSYTSEDQLFFYNRNNKNAVSAYGKVAFTNNLSLEVHGIETFGTAVTDITKALAGAARFNMDFGMFNASISGSYAGNQVDSVWGSDNTEHDDICADKVYSKLLAEIKATDWLVFGLDEKFEISNTDALSEGDMVLRNQLNFDADLSMAVNVPLSIGAYAVCDFQKLASENKGSEFLFNEAGIEIVTDDLIGMKKMVFDYAVKNEDDILYNSLMFNADITDKFNVHVGGLYRINSNKEDKTFVPFGVAAGFTVKKLSLPGNPQIYVHGCYGMNPYSENQYSLYRADNSLNMASHRTYLLSDLYEDYTKSQISVGMIWALE